MKTFRKAVVAFLIAGTGALATAAADDALTLGDWTLTVAVATAALGAVYAVPNAKEDEAA